MPSENAFPKEAQVQRTGGASSAKPATKPKLFIPSLKSVTISSSVPSLNSVFEEKTKEESDEPAYISGTDRNEFTESEFLNHWKLLAAKLKTEGKISLYTLMTANQPKLLPNRNIEVIVENGVQQHSLINSKVEILNYIRYNLKNFQIDLETVIQTNTIIRRPITDIEKYQAMLAKNPLLDNLRQDFNLGFE